MPAANVPMEIDQGEDWTCQILWTDASGDPIAVTIPIRMDIKDQTQTVVSLTTDSVPAGEIPEVSYSAEVGLIQLHIPSEQTAAMPPGLYQYDLFCSVDDGDVYAGNQQQRLLAGQVVVNKRITVI
jgi:hypothetical protein